MRVSADRPPRGARVRYNPDCRRRAAGSKFLLWGQVRTYAMRQTGSGVLDGSRFMLGRVSNPPWRNKTRTRPSGGSGAITSTLDRIRAYIARTILRGGRTTQRISRERFLRKQGGFETRPYRSDWVWPAAVRYFYGIVAWPRVASSQRAASRQWSDGAREADRDAASASDSAAPAPAHRGARGASGGFFIVIIDSCSRLGNVWRRKKKGRVA